MVVVEGWNVHLAISLRIRLRRIAHADDLPVRQPSVHLLHSTDFVGLRALRQTGQEPGKIHPGRVAQDDGSAGVEVVQEGTEEGVEVVRGGGEVEP